MREGSIGRDDEMREIGGETNPFLDGGR